MQRTPLESFPGGLKKDLERFKEFIESRPSETGAWRGTIERNV
jgi:hypothetical protein